MSKSYVTRVQGFEKGQALMNMYAAQDRDLWPLRENV